MLTKEFQRMQRKGECPWLEYVLRSIGNQRSEICFYSVFVLNGSGFTTVSQYSFLTHSVNVVVFTSTLFICRNAILFCLQDMESGRIELIYSLPLSLPLSREMGSMLTPLNPNSTCLSSPDSSSSPAVPREMSRSSVKEVGGWVSWV